MRLEQLRYLSNLQYTNSISKTANHFFLSQQSLSNNIRQLEKELGVNLLERSPFGVELTTEARELLALSDPFLQQYDDLQNQFSLQRDTTEKKIKSIVIYNSSVLTSVVLPSAIAIFSKKYPKIRIQIKELSHTEIFPAIMQNQNSFAFLSINEEYFQAQLGNYEPGNIHYHIMLKDHLVACISAQSLLAEKEIITQSDLANRPLTYLNIVPIIKHSTSHNNRVLYSSHNVEFHRRILREIDVVSLMPRNVYTSLFDHKHFVAKPLEGAQQNIYHAAIYPSVAPHPIMKELVNIVHSLI